MSTVMCPDEPCAGEHSPECCLVTPAVDDLRERVAAILAERITAGSAPNGDARWLCTCDAKGPIEATYEDSRAGARHHIADAVLAAIDVAGLVDKAREDGRREAEKALRDELVQLWSDMDWAIRDAHNGGWSIRCENLADRIATLSRIVGAARWEDIDVTVLRSGVYERVHRDAGIEHPPVDWGRVAEVEAIIAASVAGVVGAEHGKGTVRG